MRPCQPSGYPNHVDSLHERPFRKQQVASGKPEATRQDSYFASALAADKAAS